MTAYYEERIADSLKKIADAVEKIADVLTSMEAVNFAKQASVGGVESPAQSCTTQLGWSCDDGACPEHGDWIECQGCGEKFYDWRALREHLDLVPDPQYPDSGYLLSKTHIGSATQRVWPCPDKDCGLLFFHDDPKDDHWHETHEDKSYFYGLTDECAGGYCSAPDGDPASVTECMKHSGELR